MSTPSRSRELIRTVALEAFERQGYGSTTMSYIRRAAGVSTGSLYHHFPSKEHLTAALFAEGVDDYQDGFLATLRAAADAHTGVRAGVLFHVRWARNNRVLARFLLGALEADVAAAAKDELAPRTRAFMREVHAWLALQVNAGEICELPRYLYYPMWIGPAQELLRQWLAGRTKAAIGEAGERLADCAWRSLRASG